MKKLSADFLAAIPQKYKITEGHEDTIVIEKIVVVDGATQNKGCFDILAIVAKGYFFHDIIIYDENQNDKELHVYVNSNDWILDREDIMLINDIMSFVGEM